MELDHPTDADLLDGILAPVWREDDIERDIEIGEPVLDENYGMLGYVRSIDGGDVVVAFRRDASGDWVYADFSSHDAPEGILRCSLD